MSKNGLLLVGHGSRLQYNKELITTTAQMMAEKTDKYLIKSCFMENSAPTVPEGLDAMRNEDLDLLVVVPLFLAKGIHVRVTVVLRDGVHLGRLLRRVLTQILFLYQLVTLCHCVEN